MQHCCWECLACGTRDTCTCGNPGCSLQVGIHLCPECEALERDPAQDPLARVQCLAELQHLDCTRGPEELQVRLDGKTIQVKVKVTALAGARALEVSSGPKCSCKFPQQKDGTYDLLSLMAYLRTLL